MSRSKINLQDQVSNTDVNFVSRWSKLKYESKQKSQTIAVDVATSDESTEDKTLIKNTVEDKQQAAVKILSDDDMPDIESMTADSDYTDFLSPGVSEELRNLALRKLFLSEVFNIRDGLDEYDDDFTHFESLGDIVTADMKHQIELQAQRKAEDLLQHEKSLTDNDIIENESVEDNCDDVENNISDSAEVDSVSEQHDFKNNNKTVAEKNTSTSTRTLDENAEYIDLKTNKTDENTG
ncbi:MAG: DUF3306 domain-containing protein [Gammaproteobacteria bacterium]|nr:DUF3306 domain-containing protein [Gammaproteobacteria bacterium]